MAGQNRRRPNQPPSITAVASSNGYLPSPKPTATPSVRGEEVGLCGNTPYSARVPLTFPADDPLGDTPYAPLPWTPSPLGCTGVPSSRPLGTSRMGGLLGGRLTLLALR